MEFQDLILDNPDPDTKHVVANLRFLAFKGSYNTLRLAKRSSWALDSRYFILTNDLAAFPPRRPPGCPFTTSTLP